MTTSFLIADDSAGKVMMLTGMIKRAGFQGEILIAATTEEAIALIEKHDDIGFAFIDYYIPSANGPAVIQCLKQTIPDARIALVSSADNADNAQEAEDAGAEMAICTSYPADEVEASVLGLLGEWLA